MKGYIYTMFQGADPGAGWKMTDPIFDNPPVMGACMPQIRRNVDINDFIFTISGRTKSVSQYLVGGFQVQEKINAMLAYDRFPEHRQILNNDGDIEGNIIVDANGKQNPYDYHQGNFDKRIENYIIGKNPLYFNKEDEIEKARGQATLEILADVFGKTGKTPFEIIGRWRKMDEKQIKKVVSWIDELKSN
jgi:hypothetical protein